MSSTHFDHETDHHWRVRADRENVRRRWPVRPTLLLGILPVLVFVGFDLVQSAISPTANGTTESVQRLVGEFFPNELPWAVALIALTALLGWWRPVLFERRRGTPRWAVVTVVALVALELIQVSFVEWDQRPSLYFVLLAIAVLLVGIVEEFLFRGLLLVGLRSRLPEFWVWLLSSLLFGLMHLLNLLGGAELGYTLQQVLFAAAFGSVLYVTRRLTGTLIVPILLHAFWDFGGFAAGVTADPSVVDSLIGIVLQVGMLVMLLLGIITAVIVSRRDDRARRSTRSQAAVSEASLVR